MTSGPRATLTPSFLTERSTVTPATRPSTTFATSVPEVEGRGPTRTIGRQAESRSRNPGLPGPRDRGSTLTRFGIQESTPAEGEPGRDRGQGWPGHVRRAPGDDPGSALVGMSSARKVALLGLIDRQVGPAVGEVIAGDGDVARRVRTGGCRSCSSPTSG